ncbi:MAG: nicotinate-nucleotide--dimethylbenzimidazole phosphoribosyltransferase [Acidobacteria bacterium]|nr:MAG: nicotinate-nucleotide--dimethylbenzimidazole phosphoribosyltransferase [Acidobacteriota bacterium]
MNLLNRTLGEVVPVDRSFEKEIRAHLDSLTKPPGSLGYLEELAVRYCLITGTSRPRLGGKMLFCFAADHGVVAEGVSAYPQEVTAQMVGNMLAGGAAINVLARHSGVDVNVVDIGVTAPVGDAPGLLTRRIRAGTANIATGPAMSVAEAERAIEIGIELAQLAAAEGATLLGTGDMGIGNTTASSALLAALLPSDPKSVTGRGTGIDNFGLVRKVAVVERALEANRPLLSSPLDTLVALGGLEIAGICGLILGAASLRVPVIVDGFISSAAALVAWRMCPPVADYLFFSHLSAEIGHRVFFSCLEARPILDLGMRLGEGTGAALAFSVIEAAIRIYNEMATFESAGVSKKDGVTG